MSPEQGRKALEVLKTRQGRRTDVVLSSGHRLAVWDVAWGCDEGAKYEHLTTNISPGPGPDEPHTIDFVFTSEISELIEPVSGACLFEGPPGLRALAERDQEIIRACLRYVVESDALSGEFEARMGVPVRVVQDLLDRWPEIDHCGHSTPEVAVNNALNEVAHGLRISDATWHEEFRCSATYVQQVYRRWAAACGLKSTGVR